MSDVNDRTFHSTVSVAILYIINSSRASRPCCKLHDGSEVWVRTTMKVPGPKSMLTECTTCKITSGFVAGQSAVAKVVVTVAAPSFFQ